MKIMHKKIICWNYLLFINIHFSLKHFLAVKKLFQTIVLFQNKAFYRKIQTMARFRESNTMSNVQKQTSFVNFCKFVLVQWLFFLHCQTKYDWKLDYISQTVEVFSLLIKRRPRTAQDLDDWPWSLLRAFKTS